MKTNNVICYQKFTKLVHTYHKSQMSLFDSPTRIDLVQLSSGRENIVSSEDHSYCRCMKGFTYTICYFVNKGSSQI